jgi:choline-sulfatase
VVLPALLALLSCGAEETLPPELLGEAACDIVTLAGPPVARDVVLVLNDTWRRDFTGLYRGQAPTPRLDELAAESLVFDRAVTQAPWTKPSVATLFTSLYPSQHRVASTPQLRDRSRRKGEGDLMEADVLAASLPTLAEVMREGGLRTGGFTSNPWMESRFGFAQGFEIYDDSFARWGAAGDDVFAAALAWLETLPPDDHYFLYLHTIDSHRPYGWLAPGAEERDRDRLNATAPLTTGDGLALARTIRLADGSRAVEHGFRPTLGLVREAYARGVEDFDRSLGSFLDRLRERLPERWPGTAVIVTSDHGEALFERGYGNHGSGLFDDEAAIPLVARLPGVQPASGHVACGVGLVDVMPSLCAYLGLSCPDSVQGWSFVRASGTASPEERRFLVTEGVMDAPGDRSIRNARYKLVRRTSGGDATWSLYDLQADPRERFDRADPRHATPESTYALETLRHLLPVAVEALPAPEQRSEPVDPELQRRLEALGYTD